MIDRTAGWTATERAVAILAQEINDAPAEALVRDITDDEQRNWAARIRAIGNAKGWSTWSADYMDPDTEFTDAGVPPIEAIEATMVGTGEKDIPASGTVGAPGTPSTPDAAALLAHAASFEVPRPGNRLPLLLQRVHGHPDDWIILNRSGQCWARDSGGQWVAYFSGLNWLQGRASVRFPLAEAWQLATRIAATEQPGKCRRNVVDGDFGDHFFKHGAIIDGPKHCTYCGAPRPEPATDGAGRSDSAAPCSGPI